MTMYATGTTSLFAALDVASGRRIDPRKQLSDLPARIASHDNRKGWHWAGPSHLADIRAKAQGHARTWTYASIGTCRSRGPTSTPTSPILR
jgi:hypothetical protein